MEEWLKDVQNTPWSFSVSSEGRYLICTNGMGVRYFRLGRFRHPLPLTEIERVLAHMFCDNSQKAPHAAVLGFIHNSPLGQEVVRDLWRFVRTPNILNHLQALRAT